MLWCMVSLQKCIRAMPDINSTEVWNAFWCVWFAGCANVLSILFHRSMEWLQASGGLVVRIFLEPAPPPPTHFLHSLQAVSILPCRFATNAFPQKLMAQSTEVILSKWWSGCGYILRTGATSTHAPFSLLSSCKSTPSPKICYKCISLEISGAIPLLTLPCLLLPLLLVPPPHQCLLLPLF